MTTEDLRLLLWGALILGCTSVALFFVRFWVLSRDRLFLFISTAFAFLALNWTGLAVIPFEAESRHYAYVLRLVAFVLLIIGVIDKNRRGSGS